MKNKLIRPLDESGKLPPQSVDTEETVLGAILIEKGAIYNVIDILTPDDFYKENHQIVYQAALILMAKAEPIDIITMTSELRTLGKLELIGGASFLVKLSNKVNSSANIEFHARIIKQSSVRRSYIKIGSEILTSAYDDSIDVFDLQDNSQKHFFDIGINLIKGKRTDIQTQLEETFGGIKEATKGNYFGVTSKYDQINKHITCYENGNLYYVGARPAMGKSAFMINEAEDMAARGIPVKIFSLEMTYKQQLQRVLAMKSLVDLSQIKKGTLDTDDWKRLDEARYKIGLYGKNFEIIDDSNVGLGYIASVCRKEKLQGNLGAVFIDYLGLMEMLPETTKKSTNDQIAAISRGLKVLAKELDVPFIVLVQLSRAVETRGGDKRPQLADLRDSGSIEQDADAVFFLYRPEYYKISQYADGSSTAGICEIIIAKNRGGEVTLADNEVKLTFLGQYQKMTAPLLSIQPRNNRVISVTDPNDFPF